MEFPAAHNQNYLQCVTNDGICSEIYHQKTDAPQNKQLVSSLTVNHPLWGYTNATPSGGGFLYCALPIEINW